MSMGEVDDRVSHVFTTSHIPEMWSRARNLMHESILKPELLNKNLMNLNQCIMEKNHVLVDA